MELNSISEKRMIQLFKLAMVSKIREHIRSIVEQFKSLWEVFLYTLKDEYFLKDTDWVTKKSFLEWIEWSNKNL